LVNLSDSTPAPINGGSNVRWQQDASGNTSGYVAKRKITVAPVAGVVTLDASQADSFLITVNAPITSMVITNPTDGQEITILWAQDTGGHAVAVATNLLMGTLTVSTAASKHTTGKFTYNVSDTSWYVIGQSGL
jgi:hypothetical protein